MAGEIVQFNPATMAAPGGHYSHSISANGFVFVSGQLPIAPDGTKLNEAPFAAQARQVLDNVAQALANNALVTQSIVKNEFAKKPADGMSATRCNDRDLSISRWQLHTKLPHRFGRCHDGRENGVNRSPA